MLLSALLLSKSSVISCLTWLQLCFTNLRETIVHYRKVDELQIESLFCNL